MVCLSAVPPEQGARHSVKPRSSSLSRRSSARQMHPYCTFPSRFRPTSDRRRAAASCGTVGIRGVSPGTSLVEVCFIRSTWDQTIGCMRDRGEKENIIHCSRRDHLSAPPALPFFIPVVIRSARRFFRGCQPGGRANRNLREDARRASGPHCPPYLRTSVLPSSPARLASIARSQPTRWLVIRPTGGTHDPSSTQSRRGITLSTPCFPGGPVRHRVRYGVPIGVLIPYLGM